MKALVALITPNLKEYRVFDDQTANIECDIRGDPTPKIYFIKDGVKLPKIIDVR